MSNDLSERLWALFDETPVASLGVHEGEGGVGVSLVPYVVDRAGPVRFVVLVSALSPHTEALRQNPRAGLMVSAAVRPDDRHSHHAQTRFSCRVTARFVSREEAAQRGDEAAYRARFAIAETLLGLSDFHFVALTPEPSSARFVMGFGRAYTLTGEAFEGFNHERGR